MLRDTVSALFFNNAILDPTAAAHHHALNMGSHYAAIAADPPDPNFRKLTLMDPILELIPSDSSPLSM